MCTFYRGKPGSPTRTPNTSDDEEDDSLSQCSYLTFSLLSPQEYISYEELKILKVHDANALLDQEPKPFKKIEKADQVTFVEDKALKPNAVKNIKADEPTNTEDEASKIKKMIKVKDAKLLVVQTPKPLQKIKKANQVTIMEDKAPKPFCKKIIKAYEPANLEDEASHILKKHKTRKIHKADDEAEPREKEVQLREEKKLLSKPAAHVSISNFNQPAAEVFKQRNQHQLLRPEYSL